MFEAHEQADQLVETLSEHDPSPVYSPDIFAGASPGANCHLTLLKGANHVGEMGKRVGHIAVGKDVQILISLRKPCRHGAALAAVFTEAEDASGRFVAEFPFKKIRRSISRCVIHNQKTKIGIGPHKRPYLRHRLQGGFTLISDRQDD